MKKKEKPYRIIGFVRSARDFQSLFFPHPPERMSVRGGGGGGGGKGNNGISTIPASSRKMVQSLKEIVNNLCTEQEIYFTLKECNMDPDEAVNRLLSQGPWLWLLSNLHLSLSLYLLLLSFLYIILIFLFFFLGHSCVFLISLTHTGVYHYHCVPLQIIAFFRFRINRYVSLFALIIVLLLPK